MITFKNVWAYFQGNLRYRLYYNTYLYKLLRKHILEQIDFRIFVMSKPCYEQGACTECGCMTTHLQCADKMCGGPCYPPMMSKEQWYRFHHLEEAVVINGEVWRMKRYYNFEYGMNIRVLRWIKIFRNGTLINNVEIKVHQDEEGQSREAYHSHLRNRYYQDVKKHKGHQS